MLNNLGDTATKTTSRFESNASIEIIIKNRKKLKKQKMSHIINKKDYYIVHLYKNDRYSLLYKDVCFDFFKN